MNEDRLRRLLRDQRAPDEQAAEQRGWHVVRGALAQREPAPRHPRRRRLVLAGVAACVLLAGALTPPGQAVADWLQDAVRPGRDDARAALDSLPARGRLLVTSQRGPWIVDRDGSKRLLGGYEDASWSPQGLFVVVTRGHEVIALEPGGQPRWSLARPGRVRAARWSPDGFRIAYRSGSSLRVVAGDGTGDRALVREVAPTAAEWWPRARHRLAYADPRGRVAVIDADSARLHWRSAPAEPATQLTWSSDGTRLLALSPRRLRLFDSGGRLLADTPAPGAARAATAAFRPGSRAFALVTHLAGERSRIELVRADDLSARQRLLAGAGRFGDVAWSPDGDWLLAGWPDADQWVFIRAGAEPRPAIERLRAVRNIAAQFDPGGRGRAAFPGLAGWCCTAVGLPK